MMHWKQAILPVILAACIGVSGCGNGETVREEKDAVTTAAPSEIPQRTNEEKAAFLERAAEIEAYDVEQLQNARSQMDINREAGIVYERWDALLNDIWKYLKETLPETEYEALLEEQLAWIADKEAAMEAVSADWRGGTGEPMARFGEGSAYTSARCFELIDRIQ